jgi:hypothetical protein
MSGASSYPAGANSPPNKLFCDVLGCHLFGPPVNKKAPLNGAFAQISYFGEIEMAQQVSACRATSSQIGLTINRCRDSRGLNFPSIARQPPLW